MRDLIIIGAGGFGRETKALANPRNYDSILLCDSEDVLDIDGTFLSIVSVGNPKIRKSIVCKLENDIRWLNKSKWRSGIIASNTHYVSGLSYRHGTIICAGCIISINCKIGKHVQINFACTIGHDVVIGDFVTISPGVHISGNVTIGDEVFIGTGALIREKLTIGKGATIGMGAVVVKDVPAGMVVVGNPAKEMK